jgi:elongation factor 1-alpha
MTDNSAKQHVSIVIAGHVDAGKSTTTGHLLFDLGGINERDMAKLQAEADAVGKGSFAFAFHMDRQKEEQRRGVTITCTVKEFFTESKHYSIVDAPGHRDFIKNMISGASQADVALLMVPADGNFTTSIAKGNLKAGEVQGQTRQHALLLNLLGVKQLIIGINKMDCDVAQYGKERFDEIKNEMVSMLTKVGWKKEFISNNVAFLPLSGFKGDNLVHKTKNMDWWKGSDITVADGPKKGQVVHVDTLVDVLDKVVYIPERNQDAVMRMPVGSVLKIKGVGDVITGRVEQGSVKPGAEVKFLPTHTKANLCVGKIFTVEMHNTSVPVAGAGMNVGLNIKGLDKANMPKNGDTMVLKSDTTVGAVKSFVAQIKVLTHPGKLKVGYSPIGFVRTSRSALKMAEIQWNIGKSTGGKKANNPPFLEAGDAAQVVFEPLQPFVVDAFTNCEGLGRIAIMEGNSVVMLGKVLSVELKE